MSRSARAMPTFTGVHWNLLHEEFYQNSGGEAQLTKMGNLIANVLQGYLIDKATADEYGHHQSRAVAGIRKSPAIFDADGDGMGRPHRLQSGLGLRARDRAIKLPEYGLGDTVRHNQGSYFALMADTIARFEQDEPILYYTWTPLWVSGRAVPGEDVEWLEVPIIPRFPTTMMPRPRTPLPTVSIWASPWTIIRVLFQPDGPRPIRLPRASSNSSRSTINDVSAQNLLMREGEDSMSDHRGAMRMRGSRKTPTRSKG